MTLFYRLLCVLLIAGCSAELNAPTIGEYSDSVEPTETIVVPVEFDKGAEGTF